MTDLPNHDDETLRIARDFGRAFDEVALVRPGDEALIARVVDRTPGMGNRRMAVRRWGLTAAMAAGFLLVAGAAAAYWAGIRIGPFGQLPRPQSDDTVPPAPRASAAAVRPPRISPAPAEGLVPVAVLDPVSDRRGGAVRRASDASRTSHASRTSEASPTSIDGRSIVRPAARPADASPVPTVAPSPLPAGPATSSGVSGGDVTPAKLFRRAGAARRAGTFATACALYDDLQARFPAAEEARLSHVSLGKLLLVMGRPEEAEHHFATYLASGAGALAAEATFGRAQSFEKMGRSREERETWQGLLRNFPGSVYDAAARRRIAALDESGVRSGSSDSAP